MPGIDFDRLRREITMEQVLDLLGFEPSHEPGEQWYGRCPLHDCTAASSSLLLRERGDRPLLLPQVSQPRQPA